MIPLDHSDDVSPIQVMIPLMMSMSLPTARRRVIVYVSGSAKSCAAGKLPRTAT